MKQIISISTCSMFSLFFGCANLKQAAITTAAAAAGGATAGGLAYTISKGNPLITAGSTLAGATGGALLGSFYSASGKKSLQESYATGYELGKSDAAKQQYWIARNLQKTAEGNVREKLRYYQISIDPEPGAKINKVPYSVTIPLYE